jgi:hypothetical protein
MQCATGSCRVVAWLKRGSVGHESESGVRVSTMALVSLDMSPGAVDRLRCAVTEQINAVLSLGGDQRKAAAAQLREKLVAVVLAVRRGQRIPALCDEILGQEYWQVLAQLQAQLQEAGIHLPPPLAAPAPRLQLKSTVLPEEAAAENGEQGQQGDPSPAKSSCSASSTMALDYKVMYLDLSKQLTVQLVQAAERESQETNSDLNVCKLKSTENTTRWSRTTPPQSRQG